MPLPADEASDDDPFDVFGPDEEDEDEDHAPIARAPSPSSLSTQFTTQASKGSQQLSSDPVGSDSSRDSLVQRQPGIETLVDLDLSGSQVMTVCNDFLGEVPLFKNPVINLVHTQKFGGGRAYVANLNLSVGSLVLLEKPMWYWPDGLVGTPLSLVFVKYLLGDLSLESLELLDKLHPSKSPSCEKNDALEGILINDFRLEIRNQVGAKAQLDRLVSFAHEINKKYDETDIIRLLLVLRFNGLSSGLYIHVAMLNHACRPNCIKYMPENSKDGTKVFSEVRACRSVKSGDALTISYLDNIVSHATRRFHLWEQHRFDIGETPEDEVLVRMEMIGGQIPPSSIKENDESRTTFRIEKATRELEEMFHVHSQEVRTPSKDSSSSWESLKALELSTIEFYQEAKEQLKNTNHLLLVPILQLHLSVADILQSLSSKWNASSSILTSLCCRVVKTCYQLLPLQTMLCGDDHPDVANTHFEYCQALERLLTQAPDKLLKMKLLGLGNFNACSKREHNSRKQYERIKALYPHDAEQHLLSKYS